MGSRAHFETCRFRAPQRFGQRRGERRPEPGGGAAQVGRSRGQPGRTLGLSRLREGRRQRSCACPGGSAEREGRADVGGLGDPGLDRRRVLPRSRGSQSGETCLQQAVSGREAAYPASPGPGRGARGKTALRCGAAGKPGPGTAWGAAAVGEEPPGREGSARGPVAGVPGRSPTAHRGQEREKGAAPPASRSSRGNRRARPGADVGAGPAEVAAWGVLAAMAGSPAWPPGRAVGADVRTRPQPTYKAPLGSGVARTFDPNHPPHTPVPGSFLPWCRPPRRRGSTAFPVATGSGRVRAREGVHAASWGAGTERSGSAPRALCTVGVSVQTTLSEVSDKLRKTEWRPHRPRHGPQLGGRVIYFLSLSEPLFP